MEENKKSKYNIGNIGKSNIIHFDSKFSGNSSGGVINTSSLQTCHICQEIVSECQCENKLKKQLKNEVDRSVKTSTRPTLEHLIGKDVAVKKPYLSLPNISESDLKEIRKEIDILKNLRNRYVIQYYDSYSDNQELLIIMDYAENGLTYIHHKNIIHRDLKSMNILLTKKNDVKISDFGLSKTKTISASSDSKVVGTLGWMAPEVLSSQKYSEQSDIYALVRLHVVEDNEREIIPDDTPINVRNIITGCWKKDPDKRITLTNILTMIDPQEKQEKVAIGLVNQEKLSDDSTKLIPGKMKELLQQIRPENEIDLEKCLIKKHDIRQNNGADCGVAVIGTIRRIRELTTDSS
ncbi:41255_t:CDS:2 [Gigaspora margarita]|uniref:41255_t:CDS:1 n=1 Tax=Gigaspora margarita TaxID=4874 RepID=A0ABN7W7X3_GIGMA|nr:41255_t:CDS:2 [Gigaspora margarita]